jgi:hypothetical protein
MNRLLTFFLLIFSFLTTNAQIEKKVINSAFLKFYPIDIPEIFIDQPLYGQIIKVDITKDDTINYQIYFDKKRINSIVFDSIEMNLSYRFGRLSSVEHINKDSTIDKMRIIKILPFIWVFNNGLSHTGFQLFGKTYKMKQVSGLTTISKEKVKYRKGRVSLIKYYGWQTVAQHCYFMDYSVFDYPNDNTVIKRIYDSNDSLAFETRFVFDEHGNIMNSDLLSRKRASGWGIDVTYYTYDAEQISNSRYDYRFDEYGNWTERFEYLNDTLQSHEIREFFYKE